MTLRDGLEKVAASLVAGGFAEVGESTVRDVAVESGRDVFPLELFIAWVDRTPEARRELGRLGIAWEGVAAPGGDTPRVVSLKDIAAEPPEGSPAARIRVLGDHGEYVPADLLGTVAGMYKVRMVGGSGVGFQVIAGGKIHHADRKKAEAFAALVGTRAGQILAGGNDPVSLDELRKSLKEMADGDK